MLILGVDTATAVASVALLRDGKPILDRSVGPSDPERRLARRANHAEILLPLIDSELKEAGVSLTDLSALAVSIGPGSFTGLRIGLSTVKGLACGWEIPVVGVPTLLATAARVSDREGLICAILDARKSEVYAALFRRKGKMLQRLSEDLVAPPESLMRRLASLPGEESLMFIGEGVLVYGELIKDFFGERCSLTLGESYASTAVEVARIAEGRLAKGEVDALGPLLPLYIRPSEAELKIK